MDEFLRKYYLSNQFSRKIRKIWNDFDRVRNNLIKVAKHKVLCDFWWNKVICVSFIVELSMRAMVYLDLSTPRMDAWLISAVAFGSQCICSHYC